MTYEHLFKSSFGQAQKKSGINIYALIDAYNNKLEGYVVQQIKRIQVSNSAEESGQVVQKFSLS